MATIHSTAIIHSSAELGMNVSVGPFALIDEHVRIGDNTVIGPHVTLYKNTVIGSNCSVHDNAVIGDLPQDLAFKNVPSYVRIGSHCVIREGVTIHRGTKPETSTEVGNNCFLMVNSHLAHNVKLGTSVIIANGALLAGYVEAGDNAFISGNCVIHQFVRIGKVAILGGACAIGQDVPPFCMTRPAVANQILGLNVIGMRRAEISVQDRQMIRKAFHILYQSGLTGTQAVEKMKEQFPSGPAYEFWTFVKESKRGICSFSGSQHGAGEGNN